MKKLFPLALTAVLTLSMGVTAFASSNDSGLQAKLDKAPVVIKTYQVNNGKAPAETFTFSFTGLSYTNGNGEIVAGEPIPAIADVSIAYTEGDTIATKDVDAAIDVNDYKLGIYKYKVTEKSGNTAGVTYSDEDLYLVLTILRDENDGHHYVAAMHYENESGVKTKGFTNKYDSGSLSVKKLITGNMAITDTEFDFDITFTAPSNKTVSSAITVTKPDGETETIHFESGKTSLKYEIELGDEDTVIFSNLPAGVTYTVAEEAGKYTSSMEFSNTSKKIAANATDTVTVTNNMNNENIDLGVVTDNLPYMLMLAGAGAGLLVPFGKRYRKSGK